MIVESIHTLPTITGIFIFYILGIASLTVALTGVNCFDDSGVNINIAMQAFGVEKVLMALIYTKLYVDYNWQIIMYLEKVLLISDCMFNAGWITACIVSAIISDKKCTEIPLRILIPTDIFFAFSPYLTRMVSRIYGCTN
jgi:hypothetical protein